MDKKFFLTSEKLDALCVATAPNRTLAGLDERNTSQLHWHIKNAALAVSGTAQMASYNGLVTFVAAHYAKLRNCPAGEQVDELAIGAMKAKLPAIRRANDDNELHIAYTTLVSNIGKFFESALEPAAAPTTAQLKRRRTIANALWTHWRENEGRGHVELDELPLDHSVWGDADAVMAALALEPQEPA